MAGAVDLNLFSVVGTVLADSLDPRDFHSFRALNVLNVSSGRSVYWSRWIFSVVEIEQ